MKTNKRYTPSLKSLRLLFFLTISLVISTPITTWSQCSIGGVTCEQATAISFPFNGRMNSEIIGAGEVQGCPGTTLDNTTWYRFVPTTFFASIDVSVSNCTMVMGNVGIQVGLFPDCDPSSSSIGAFQCACIPPGQTITLGTGFFFTINQPYYIFVDGCSGSTCDLEMILTLGEVVEVLPVVEAPEIPAATPAGPTCQGAALNFIVPPVSGAVAYNWNLPNDATIISQDCNSIDVTWGASPGDVSVIVTDSIGEEFMSPALTMSVEPISYSVAGSYCGSNSNGYLFNGNNLIYEEGIHNIEIPGINCDTLVTLTVNNTQPILTFTSSNQTCEDEGFATVEVSGTTTSYTFQWSNNATTPTIDNLIGGTYRVTVTDFNGCTAEGSVFIEGDFDLNTNSTLADCDQDNGTATVMINGGISNPSFNWSNGASTETNTDLSPGFYSVTVTDTDTDCQVHQNIEVSEDPDCSVRISGTAFLNTVSSDCVIDSTNVPFAFIQLTLSDGQIVYTDEDGFYEFTADAGDYTIYANSPFPGLTSVCHDSLEVSAPTLGTNYEQNDFYFTTLPYGDLVVKLVKPNARPGFEQRPRICLMNVGGDTLSGTLTLEFPSEQNFVSANPPEDLYDQTNQILTWNFIDIPPGTTRIYRLTLSLPVGTPLGTPLTYTATADSGNIDETPENNTITCSILVTGSYDPNDKAVNPAGEGVEGFIPPSDTTLSYTVRFQNTGTDTAFTVLIRDTLSEELDVHSLMPGPASHNYTAKVVDGNVLELLFENIMLPDSFVNEPASNGFVIFDINLSSNRAEGTVIENRAAIFFDFNPPIITNEVKNTIKQLVTTKIPEEPLSLQLSPNPVHSTSTLSFELLEAENIDIKVYDLLGNLQENLVSKETYQAGEHQISIDTENYSAGVYFITIKTRNDQMATVKMVRL